MVLISSTGPVFSGAWRHVSRKGNVKRFPAMLPQIIIPDIGRGRHLCMSWDPVIIHRANHSVFSTRAPAS